MPLNPLIPLSVRSPSQQQQIFQSARRVEQQNELFDLTRDDLVESQRLSNQTAQQNLQLGEQKLSEAELDNLFNQASGVEALYGVNDPQSIAMARSHPQGAELADQLEAYFADPSPVNEARVNQSFDAINDARRQLKSAKDGAPHVVKFFPNDKGQMVAGMSDSTTVVTGQNAAVDYHFEKRKSEDENGNIIETMWAYPKRNLGNGSFQIDRTAGAPVDMAGDNTGRINFSAQTPDLNPATGDPGINLGAAVQTVEGAEAREAAKTRGKLNETRFSKLIAEAPSDMNMSRFISTLADTALDSAQKAKVIIEKNPGLTTGLGSKIFIDNSGEKPSFRTLPGGIPNPALQVFALMEQFFGGAAFQTLQTMRAASPTGGALGQVSNFEISLLKSQWGAFLQEADAGFNLQQMDVLIDRAELVQQVTAIEMAAYGQMAGMTINDKDAIREIQLASMSQIADVYAAHGRTSGTWDMETMKYVPPKDDGKFDLKPGSENTGRFEVLELDN